MTSDTIYVLSRDDATATQVREVLARAHGVSWASGTILASSLLADELRATLADAGLSDAVELFDGHFPAARIAHLSEGTRMLIDAHSTRQAKAAAPSLPWDSPDREPPVHLERDPGEEE